jgi:hypothetical protein
MGFNTHLNSIKVATRVPKSQGSCRDVVVAARAGLGPSVAAFVGFKGGNITEIGPTARGFTGVFFSGSCTHAI